jgi:predicted RNA-binding protein
MCLSNVFVKKKEEGAVVAHEASSVVDLGGRIEIQTLFGEKQVLEGYRIREVNLLKNFIILDDDVRKKIDN